MDLYCQRTQLLGFIPPRLPQNFIVCFIVSRVASIDHSSIDCDVTDVSFFSFCSGTDVSETEVFGIRKENDLTFCILFLVSHVPGFVGCIILRGFTCHSEVSIISGNLDPRCALSNDRFLFVTGGRGGLPSADLDKGLLA